ncbi:glutamate racemase, partial [Kitasatospora sp. NPDC127121]|uniref:glutamate racemase n=1 Tax=Kitasatospora sp. NPDC127121 TaxID=3345371 RepID=UPI0036362619
AQTTGERPRFRFDAQDDGSGEEQSSDRVMVPGPDAQIGIFDSGFGGLTVARAVLDRLPWESIVYLADSARSPYGPRSIAEVRSYALECLDQLVALGVKMLVIACNSASSAMLRDARERYDVPVIEVICPSVREAAAVTRSGRVGVICTAATKTSMSYEDAFAAAPHVRLTVQSCPRFVDFVERGVVAGPGLAAAAREYLAVPKAAGVDTLVLGCTHYPLLAEVIADEMGEGVSLISSAEESAKDVAWQLGKLGLARARSAPRHVFMTTGDPRQFQRIGRRFLGPVLTDVAAAVR